MTEQPQPQLQMRFYPQRQPAPEVRAPAGYTLRTYCPGDEAGFFELMAQAGFGSWDMEKLRPWFGKILPDGWFVIIDPSGKLVATTMANHNPGELHPFGGEMGWVAADPTHAGKGLGLAVCAAATARLVRGGYHEIYLLTDDWRLPAIKTYLKLGWAPWLFRDGMAERWQAVCSKLNWAYTPEAW
jgi:mycothiol synthase